MRIYLGEEQPTDEEARKPGNSIYDLMQLQFRTLRRGKLVTAKKASSFLRPLSLSILPANMD